MRHLLIVVDAYKGLAIPITFCFFENMDMVLVNWKKKKSVVSIGKSNTKFRIKIIKGNRCLLLSLVIRNHFKENQTTLFSLHCIRFSWMALTYIMTAMFEHDVTHLMDISFLKPPPSIHATQLISLDIEVFISSHWLIHAFMNVSNYLHYIFFAIILPIWHISE